MSQPNQAGARATSLEQEMPSPTVDPLFERFQLKTLDLPNRIVMAPMTRSCSPGGVPGPDVAAYYRRRAEGGIGLIITEGTWIPHRAASNEENVPRFYGEDALAGWADVLREVHAVDGRIVPQLWHTGLTRRPAPRQLYEVIEEDLSLKVSPSGFVAPGEQVGEPMAEAEADAIIAAYAESAASAQQMGFDGIELHGAHGYLLDQFFWGKTNYRQDRFGGADLRARTQFAVEVVRACRARVGADFPILLRFSQWKLVDFHEKLARTPEQLENLLGPLSDAGVDIFHASTRRYDVPEFEGSPLNLAGWAKKLTGKPSMTVGSVGLAREVENAEDIGGAAVQQINPLLERLGRGEFDLVAVGRAVISDPDWALKVRRRDFESLRPFDSADLFSLG